MKLYTNRETAPLKFHKFYRFVYLPYEVLLSIQTIIGLIIGYEHFISFVIGISFNLTTLICIILCMVGFGSWKAYAWKALMTYRTLYIAFTLFTLFIALMFFPEHVPTEAVYFSYCLFTSGPILLYYAKRRFLFLPNQNPDQSTHMIHSESHICPTCGKVSPIEYRFCPSCDTPFPKK